MLQAVAMILLVVGISEKLLGTWPTVRTFLLSHFAALGAFAIGVAILHWLHFGENVRTLYTLHDVGPSAGYYGCLGGLVIARHFRFRTFTILAIFAFLFLRVAVSLVQMPDSQISLSADIVHLLATSIGMCAGFIASDNGKSASQMQQDDRPSAS